MPIDNSRGIFADKKSLVLAKKYSLELYDKRAYILNDPSKQVSYRDVRFIITSLWIDHFMYGSAQPLITSTTIYNRYREEYLNHIRLLDFELR